MVERAVREVLTSFLADCRSRPEDSPCWAADFGANNGWMSMTMLSLGANVISVEPASDFADAINKSAALNCWSHRSIVINAFACERKDRGPRSCMRSRKAWTGYRAGGGPPAGLRNRLRETPGVTIGSILLSRGSSLTATAETSLSLRNGRSEPLHYDLLKLDGDGPEGGWMRAIDNLITKSMLSVDVITVEGNNLAAVTMRRFQRLHGYTIYRLQIGDPRRYIGPTGWDERSPADTPMASLVHKGAQKRNAWEKEIFGLRAMRQLFKASSNLTVEQWETLLAPIKGYAGHQWLLTRGEELREAFSTHGRSMPSHMDP